MEITIQKYLTLRDSVDQIAAKLVGIHSERMACRVGCCECCMNLSVWPVEFFSIIEEIKAAGRPKPQLNDAKECCFLDEQGHCQIYPFRPLICRTHGLPLVYWCEENTPPGYGVMFCRKNFTGTDEIDFGSDNTLDMDTINEKLARLNIDFVEARKDLSLRPTTRIELQKILDYL